MFCSRCGRSVPEGARFCPNCGAAVTVVALPDDEPTRGPGPYAPPGTPDPALAAPSLPAWAMPSGGGGGSAAAALGHAELPEAMVTPLPAELPAYGGFWRRTFAAILDGILLTILLSPLYLAWVWPVLMNAGRTRPDDMDPNQALAIVGTLLGYLAVAGLVETAYFAFLESSTHQASLGKLAMGLKLTDLTGARITFGKAVLRRVARTLTAFTFLIGFLMMLWTRRRQTLHDLMAGTLVLRR
jgi:uncharacterized RDD family membrane protein YckC